jgi:capsular polysaccharide biosynthesis protein
MSEPQPLYEIAFISRRQYDATRTIGRVLSNENEVVSYIESNLPPNWKLTLYRPELITSLEDYVQRLEGISILVGIHGAGLANLLFMRSGTHIVEIFSGDRGPVNRHYYNMCKWLDIKYSSPGYFESVVDPTFLWGNISSAIANVEGGIHFNMPPAMYN